MFIFPCLLYFFYCCIYLFIILGLLNIVVCHICLYIVGILNPRVEDMSYISVWKFFDCFAGGGWVCIVLPSHTPLHIMSGALYPGLWSFRNRGVV